MQITATMGTLLVGGNVFRTALFGFMAARSSQFSDQTDCTNRVFCWVLFVWNYCCLWRHYFLRCISTVFVDLFLRPRVECFARANNTTSCTAQLVVVVIVLIRDDKDMSKCAVSSLMMDVLVCIWLLFYMLSKHHVMTQYTFSIYVKYV